MVGLLNKNFRVTSTTVLYLYFFTSVCMKCTFHHFFHFAASWLNFHHLRIDKIVELLLLLKIYFYCHIITIFTATINLRATCSTLFATATAHINSHFCMLPHYATNRRMDCFWCMIIVPTTVFYHRLSFFCGLIIIPNDTISPISKVNSKRLLCCHMRVFVQGWQLLDDYAILRRSLVRVLVLLSVLAVFWGFS